MDLVMEDAVEMVFIVEVHTLEVMGHVPEMVVHMEDIVELVMCLYDGTCYGGSYDGTRYGGNSGTVMEVYDGTYDAVSYDGGSYAGYTGTRYGGLYSGGSYSGTDGLCRQEDLLGVIVFVTEGTAMKDVVVVRKVVVMKTMTFARPFL